MMGAMICAAITGILIIVGDFSGGYWRNSYVGTEGWFYISAWSTWYGFLILIPLGGLMLMTAARAMQGMRDPGLITIKMLNQGFWISLAIAGLLLILGIAFAVYMVWEDYNDWWFDVGFYGGLIGGIITGIVFHQAKKEAQAQGIRPE
jgi:hypothetical protein